MQIPIISGIYTDDASNVRVAYPVNMMAIPVENGVSAGFMRPHDGITEFATGLPGVDRGGINWRGVLYRVCGQSLIRINSDGTFSTIGTISGSERVTFDYSFDRLAIAGGGLLYYYDGTTLTEVTDPDIGTVVDVVWVDGYFITTDGEFLVQTELNNPQAADPLKYGSSEVDPDPVVGLLKIRNEILAINRYTIESFDNVGGTGFAFQRIEGAQVQRGAVGTHACCEFVDVAAFIGGGRNEPISVWAGSNGTSQKLATREIDQILAGYTEQQLSTAVLEPRIDKGQVLLYMHLPNHTMIYDAAASRTLGQQVWSIASTSTDGIGKLDAIGLVWCYDKWIVGHPSEAKLGQLTESTANHWGDLVGWEVSTAITYNEGRGALFHELELISLPGNTDAGRESTVWTSYSLDGRNWSAERSVSGGSLGQTTKRLVWYGCGSMRNWRIQKFRGMSDGRLSLLRLEARLEALNY